MLTLKNVKYFAAGSQETSCFTADVLWNGKKVAIADNDGHGGETFVRWLLGSTLVKEVEAWVAGLPTVKFNFAGEELFRAQRIGQIVDDLFYKWLGEREAARLQKKWEKAREKVKAAGGVFFVMKVGEDSFMEIKSAPANVEKWKKKTIEENPGATVYFE
jgi:hypothetical protein